ncbi:MAG: ribbon-helix-helix domain-containing protein [Psychrobium sp.]
MATYTSTLPDALLELLNEKAKQLAMPKNKIIEKALSLYLDQIKRAEYIQSFQNGSSDQNILDLAEEGMADYHKQITNS